MNILIIEDEINAFEYLRSMLKKIDPSVKILAHLDSVEDSVNWLHQNQQPELIFMDIQLADGLCFEIFNYVEVKSPIIFTTAFDQYAIEAFKVNSIDYLLKPIIPEDLRKAIEKYRSRKVSQEVNYSQQIQSAFSTLNKQTKHRCLVKRGNHFEFIEVSQIAFVHSESSITFLYTFDGKRHLYSNTVEGLMKNLDETLFFQISRHQIININAVQKIHPYFNQRLKLELNIPSELEFLVSRSKLTPFKDWIDL
ncbi:MAG: response regulator transcription factor [Saprospiraceae bacterium]|nr:response regulator transcription factor [Saprospiraceae bacterium]